MGQMLDRLCDQPPAFSQPKEGRLGIVGSDGHDDTIKQLHGALDHIEMTIRDRIKAARVNRCPHARDLNTKAADAHSELGLERGFERVENRSCVVLPSTRMPRPYEGQLLSFSKSVLSFWQLDPKATSFTDFGTQPSA